MQLRRPAHDPPGITPAGSLLASDGLQPPEMIRFTVEPFTTVVQGCAYRTEPTTLVAKRVPAAQAAPLPPLSSPPPSEQASVIAASAKAGSGCVFRKKGGLLWEVVIDGGDRFYLENTLGARYLDYLLHHPNEPISAFDLEVIIQPEKGEARSRDSIQPESDPQARREYREALRRLQAEREAARAAGDPEAVERLDGEDRALACALKPGRLGPTRAAGARATFAKRWRLSWRNWKGGPEERGVCGALGAAFEHRVRVPVQPFGGADMGVRIEWGVRKARGVDRKMGIESSLKARPARRLGVHPGPSAVLRSGGASRCEAAQIGSLASHHRGDNCYENEPSKH